MVPINISSMLLSCCLPDSSKEGMAKNGLIPWHCFRKPSSTLNLNHRDCCTKLMHTPWCSCCWVTCCRLDYYTLGMVSTSFDSPKRPALNIKCFYDRKVAGVENYGVLGVHASESQLIQWSDFFHLTLRVITSISTWFAVHKEVNTHHLYYIYNIN